MIQAIVEGDGEVIALPLLLRRLLHELGCYVNVGSAPVKRHRSDFIDAEKFKRGLRLALTRENISAILVLFDLDDDCARDSMPNLEQWANEEISHLPHTIVAARREYEAWFVAALESLRGVHRIGSRATYTDDPEAKRDAKGIVSRFMPRIAAYDSVADQPALSSLFDLGQAYRGASSFRKLVTELCRVLTELGQQPVMPPEWRQD
jgi:hypothetical protein